MKKLVVILSLMLFNSAFAAGGKIIDLILSETGLIKILTQSGFEKMNIRSAKSQIELSITSLIGKNDVVSKEALLKAIGEIDNTPANREIKQSLAKILNKQGDDVSKGDVVELMNNMILLAGVKGSLVTACGECAAGPLASEGVKVALREITDDSILELVNKNVIPNSPRELSKFISNRMGRLGLGDFSKVSKDLIPDQDKEALAIFLALADKNSPATSAQRSYIQSVLDFSKNGDQVDLFSADNPHRFWAIFSDNEVNDNLLNELSTVLKKASDDTSDVAERKDAFYAALERRVDSISDPQAKKAMMDDIDSLKTKSCFFKK